MPRAYPEMVRQSLAAAPGVAGDLTLGAAVSGYAALKAAHDGATVNVSLRDGHAWEVRRDCIYDHDTLTLTRGTLVDSSTGAAVDLGAGTIMTVVRTGYEARRLPLADLDVDGNALRVVDANGNKFALLPLDANDNVLANIGHRQNTLANLLALDGVPGEISVATDVNALVVHTGVAGEAKAYRRTMEYARAYALGTNTSVPDDVNNWTTLLIGTIKRNDQTMIENATETIKLPSNASSLWAKVRIEALIGADGGGYPATDTEILVVAQYESSPGVYTDLATLYLEKVRATTNNIGYLRMDGRLEAGFANDTRLRFRARSAGGAVRFYSLRYSVELSEMV